MHVVPRRASALALALASSVLLVPSAQSASSTPVEFPRHPHGLAAPNPAGDALDDPAGYQPQMSCATHPMRGVVKLRALALKSYDRGSGDAYARSCASGATSEHKDGRAWDWMLDVNNSGDRKVAADFLAWLTKDGGVNARRLGVMYVIYNHKSWSSYDPSWASYSGYDPHTSHIHISLSWNGARAHTSFWTGHTWAYDYGTCQYFRGQPAAVATPRPRTTPCPEAVAAPRTAKGGLQWIGSTGDKVREAQQLLGLDVDGAFGTRMRSAVLDYQRAHDLPTTGAVDGATWASLTPRSATARTWTPREAAAFGRNNLGSPQLLRESTGVGTYALQVALRMPIASRNGYFGAQTTIAVKQFKADHDLAANPRVNAAVWDLLLR